jgi:hypothetical protein
MAEPHRRGVDELDCYGRFSRSEMYPLLRRVSIYLIVTPGSVGVGGCDAPGYPTTKTAPPPTPRPEPLRRPHPARARCAERPKPPASRASPAHKHPAGAYVPGTVRGRAVSGVLDVRPAPARAPAPRHRVTPPWTRSAPPRNAAATSARTATPLTRTRPDVHTAPSEPTSFATASWRRLSRPASRRHPLSVGWLGNEL